MSEARLKVHELMRSHAWGYFQLHAQQRLTTFNFYLILASVLTTALFASFQRTSEHFLVPCAIGLLLSVFSFVFARLDVRNKQLIKNAEAALRAIEAQWEGHFANDGYLTAAAVFSSDERVVVIAAKRNVFLSFVNQHWSYSRCFTIAFLSLGLLGAGTAIISLSLYAVGSK